MSTGARIVLLLFVISVIAGTVSGSELYFRISYLWGLLLVFSWLWSWNSLRGVKFSRKPRLTRAQVGQILEERFDIDNEGRLPRFWLAIRDESALPGSQGSRLFPIIEGGRGRTYLARTRLTQRGIFSLGPTTLETGDPFGLFPVSRTFPTEESILVYPLMVEISKFPNPAGILPGGEALRRRTAQITPNAAGIREYEPGDPLSRIHWISTARRNRLMSKEFELDPQAEVWIFLDADRTGQASIQSRSEQKPGGDLWRSNYEYTLPPSTEEYAVSIAASLARYFLRLGRSVGFASAGQALTVIPPDRGGRQLGKILESLAVLKAEGDLPLWGLVELQAQHILRGSSVILITHSVQEEIPLTADYLTRRGLRPVVVLIDASSFNGPAGTDRLAAILGLLRVPFRIVRRGAQLELVLSNDYSYQRT